MKYIDLSHTIFDGLITYKGLPAPIICDYLGREESKSFYENGISFQIGLIDMVAHTGTYIDCPFYRYENGNDLSEVGLEAFVDLETTVVNILDTQEIQVKHFKGRDLKDKAVLIRTGWSAHWNTEKYFYEHPFLSKEAAIYLKNNGVKLVGIDSYNIDDTRSPDRPVHSTLLKSNILIVEHLCNLESIPLNSKILFSAIPPKIRDMGTFPVRAYVKVV